MVLSILVLSIFITSTLIYVFYLALTLSLHNKQKKKRKLMTFYIKYTVLPFLSSRGEYGIRIDFVSCVVSASTLSLVLQCHQPFQDFVCPDGYAVWQYHRSSFSDPVVPVYHSANLVLVKLGGRCWYNDVITATLLGSYIM
jgi:hypothetical protein